MNLYTTLQTHAVTAFEASATCPKSSGAMLREDSETTAMPALQASEAPAVAQVSALWLAASAVSAALMLATLAS